MLIIYRILSFFINFIGFFIAVSLVVIIPIFITVPVFWLPMFLIIAVVLYTWFSNKFRIKVLIRREAVNHNLRDWIRVNGLVAIIFTMLNIPSIINIIRNPAAYFKATEDFAKQFGQGTNQTLTPGSIHLITSVMLLYLIALFVHVFWTLTLVKRNQDLFQ